ncbi:MAG: GtrA family protein [Halioglobus sp.]
MRIKLWHRQFIRFGFVGLVSTAVHVTVAFLLLDVFDLSLLIANICAFFTAMSFSYFGNAMWSFEAKSDAKSVARFFCASAVTLTMITLISNWVTETGLPPYFGIFIIALVIPIVGFILQKIWVFNR